MAIKVKVTEDNGVVTNYHRIAMLKIDTNQSISILVHSYISVDGRQIEKDYEAEKVTGKDVAFPYVSAKYMSSDYDESMTIAKAYEWLKTQPGYTGAVDC